MRRDSGFDAYFDESAAHVVSPLSTDRLFHVAVHFSSDQLTYWSWSDPYCCEVRVGALIWARDFPHTFRSSASGPTVLLVAALCFIWDGFKVLRFQDPHIYWRHGSINVANGIIGLSFSCNGSH